MRSSLDEDIERIVNDFRSIVESGILEGIEAVTKIVNDIEKLLSDAIEELKSGKLKPRDLLKYMKKLEKKIPFLTTLRQFIHNAATYIEALINGNINKASAYAMEIAQSAFAPYFAEITRLISPNKIGEVIADSIELVHEIAKMSRWLGKHKGTKYALALLRITCLSPTFTIMTNVSTFYSPIKFPEKYERALRFAKSVGVPKEMIERAKSILERIEKLSKDILEGKV